MAARSQEAALQSTGQHMGGWLIAQELPRDHRMGACKWRACCMFKLNCSTPTLHTINQPVHLVTLSLSLSTCVQTQLLVQSLMSQL